MLHLHRSNRLETLADVLAEVTRSPLADPLRAEIIVVQSLGMRRWIAQALAHRCGVAMNLDSPFPAAFARRVFLKTLETEPARALERDALPWRILELLPEFLEKKEFVELRRYVSGELGALKEYQLAQRIAAVFDRYLAYRPELILDWQGGKKRARDWQAQLWRALSEGHEQAHLPALLLRLEAALKEGGLLFHGLPERVSIFGAASLPPYYVALLGAVAQLVEVHHFQLEPTDQYWGDLVPEKKVERLSRKLEPRGLTPAELHIETGNPLLASLGKIGRDFSHALLSLDTDDHDHFVPPIRDTLLHRVQADLYELRHRAPGEVEPLPAPDQSIMVRCAHGPMREVEVLHDQLLAMFERDPSLTPRDVLVTMPDVETYGPLVEAVFGAPEMGKVYIPFTIADRTARAENTVADAFLRLLDLHGSRFGAATVLALLETAPIRARFDLADTDLDTIRGWLARSGVRWGIDAEHRTQFGVPAFEENTWRFGLRRLLLGYALPGDGQTLFAGVLPYREIEGQLASVLGRFLEFTDALFTRIPALAVARSLAEWERALRDLLDAFFAESDDIADELRRIRRTFESLGAVGDIRREFEFDVIRAHLAGAFASTDSGAGFLAGQVTFCALKPMRSIPFRVICVLGLDDGAFPRHETPLAFDLTAQHPRPGDRNLRDDDRQLFLEMLLSARDTLYLSYSGLSARDGSEAPPSVIVSELLDYLRENYALDADQFVVKERLQPFHASYFQADSPFFSFSQENAAACRPLQNPSEPKLLTTAPLPEPEGDWRTVTLDQLANFFTHPARYFARERLGLRLPDDEEPLDEREPIELDPLTGYNVKETIKAQDLGGVCAEDGLALLRAQGMLPPARAGEIVHQQLCLQSAEVVAVMKPLLAEPLPPAPLDLALGPWHVTGAVDALYAAGRVVGRVGNLNGKDRLRAWVAHVALCAAAPDGVPHQTTLVGRDGVVKFPPLENPQEQLRDLLELYARGLREPLRLFPKTSGAYIEHLRKKNDQAKALEKAEKTWTTTRDYHGEDEDAYFDFLFHHEESPLDDDFRDTAARVFEPVPEKTK